MKKPSFYLASIMLTGMSLMMVSCAKDDTTAPIITLNGDSEISIDLQQPYVELGATAIDDEDGSVTVEISGTVDINLKGQYVITYTATDEAGNIASEERVVNVVNSADLLAGAYTNAADNCNAGGPGTFNATISTSNTQNGKFSIANFGAFGTSISVDLTYNKQNQTITAIGGQSLGGGAVLTAVTNGQLLSQSPVSFSIGYTWIDSGGATDFCTSTYTK
ncbi:MAG: DUF5011 domain-containing protein [Bacteroidota bacterium]